MPLEREKIRKALLRKGFVEGGTDRDFYRLETGGKRHSIGTKLSRGSKYKDYSDDLVRDVYKQLGLTKDELISFVDCPLDYEHYVKLLRERGKIRP
jgi:hypothetical protein